VGVGGAWGLEGGGACSPCLLPLERAQKVGRAAPVAQGAGGDAERVCDLDLLAAAGEQPRRPLLLGSPLAPAAALVGALLLRAGARAA
jgi:hypothetical protein